MEIQKEEKTQEQNPNDLSQFFSATPVEKKEQPVETKTEETKVENIDTPKVEEKKEETKKTDFNVSEYFGEEFKTVDEIKSKLTEYNETKKTLAQINEEKQQLAASLKNASNPFANEEIAKLNELVKSKNRKDYDTLTKVLSDDLTAMSDVEVLKLDAIYEKPELKSKIDIIEKKILSKYELNKKLSDEMSDEEKEEFNTQIEINKLNLKDEADKVREKFAGIRGSIKLPQFLDETSKKEAEAQDIASRTTSWTPVVTPLVKEFKAYPVFVESGDGKVEKFMEFTVPDDFKAEVQPQIIQYLSANKIPLNEESLKVAANIMNTLFEARFKARIYHAIREKERTLRDEELKSKYENPSALAKDKVGDTAQPSAERKLQDQVNELLRR